MKKKKSEPRDLFVKELHERGIKRTWVAKKIGVSSSHLTNMLSGYGVLLDKHKEALNELLETNY